MSLALHARSASLARRLTPRRVAAAVARSVLGTVTSVETTERVAALTFDDGPDPRWTPPVLEILERYGARATFFMLGKSAAEHQALVKRTSEAGHAIGNHSWDHPCFPLIGARERRWQLRACRVALTPFGGRIMRPPFGYQSLASRVDAMIAGYDVVGWTMEVGDWYDSDAARMAEALRVRLRPGRIILLHDVLFLPAGPDRGPVLGQRPHPDRRAMLEALETFLAAVSPGFQFVTVPELLRRGRPIRKNWYVREAADWSR
jgi:peptidoglycan/xylan/chitin deacetylase (PgdA/CDA1 family)